MNKIKILRTGLGITQSQLAGECGWADSQSRISNYELGLREPKLRECWVIVAAFRNLGGDCNFGDVFPEPENDIDDVSSAA